VLIKQARIIDPGQPNHQKVADLLISDGRIEKIASRITNPGKYQEVKLKNLHVSAGWFDSSVSFGEPGFEERETIENGLRVAAGSGFTDIALQPSTSPVADNQAQIRFAKSKEGATSIHPIGALTKNSEGKDLAELYDMQQSGAVGFGDYHKYIANANLMKIALQYVQDFDGLVIGYSMEPSLQGSGLAHEGAAALRLGLRGIPALAEELAIARNLFLLEYAGGRLHIPTISTARSVQLIREAKNKGLQVTCSVSVHHLLLTDEILENFDTRYKVLPPLRDEATRKSLVKAVKDGIIDCITTDHSPMDVERKKMEFDRADYGTIGLESAFGALATLLPMDVIIARLTAARKIFKLEPVVVTENSPACLTLFNPDGDWTFEEKHILSTSKNSAFTGQRMKGQVYGICNNNQLILNS
jgi:dihydroorotase